MNQIAKEWQDYEVIDTGNKEKLERWNQTILRRPDPVAIWPIEDERAWNKADAVYHRADRRADSHTGGNRGLSRRHQAIIARSTSESC